jgi:hypothetical protein
MLGVFHVVLLVSMGAVIVHNYLLQRRNLPGDTQQIRHVEPGQSLSRAPAAWERQDKNETAARPRALTNKPTSNVLEVSAARQESVTEGWSDVIDRPATAEGDSAVLLGSARKSFTDLAPGWTAGRTIPPIFPTISNIAFETAYVKLEAH